MMKHVEIKRYSLAQQSRDGMENLRTRKIIKTMHLKADITKAEGEVDSIQQ